MTAPRPGSALAVVEAARALRALEREFDALPWQDRAAVGMRFVEDALPLRDALDAALEAFCADGSSSGGSST